MVLPRSGLTTKRIVPLSTIWLNRFHFRIGLKILNAVTSSADIFFLSLKWKITSRPLFWLHIIDLGNDRQSDDIHGNPRKNGFPWSCSDKFCIHNISRTKSIANQLLLIRAILSRQATRSSGAWQGKRLHGRPIPYGLSRLLCRHERCLNGKKLEKRCVTKQRTAAQD